jgi:hypothetical protein
MENISPTNNSPAIDSVTGELRLVFDEKYDGCTTICLQLEGETVTKDDKPALRAVKLSRNLSQKFDEAYFNTVFRGDTLTVQVRTSNLQQDLANGLGLRGKKPFIGLNISYYE